MRVACADEFSDVPDGPTPWALYPWLAIASGPVADVVSGRTHPAWLAGAGLTAFAVLFVGSVWVRLRTGHTRAAIIMLLVLAAVTVAMAAGFGPKLTITLFPLLSLACGAVVPWRDIRRGPSLPGMVVLLVSGLAALTAWRQHSSGSEIWQVWYGTFLGGVIVAVIFRLIDAIAELRRTRTELARTAVEAERLRFARDLHDLLGHTLSVMVLKAQAVRRLADADPAAAATHAADIERVGRDALTEVRQAVSGYRGRGLAGKLTAGRAALADAGFTTFVNVAGTPLPADVDALLGWVIREGVTNVLKHSDGQRCEITVRRTGHAIAAEIADDGGCAGGGAGPLPEGGHGLAGLRERLAAAGGTLSAGPLPAGGFRLTAAVPAGDRELDCGTGTDRGAGTECGTRTDSGTDKDRGTGTDRGAGTECGTRTDSGTDKDRGTGAESVAARRGQIQS